MTLAARLAVYAPNGARQGVLPTPQTLEASAPLNDVPALAFAYAEGAPRASLLAGPVEVALEVSHDGAAWVEPPDCRYLRLERTGDRIGDQGRVWDYACPGYLWALDKVKVYPNGLLNPDGKREFLSATPGSIIRTLLLEGQERGAAAGFTFGTFAIGTDSSGAAWSRVVSLYLEPGTSVLSILLNLAEQGLVDFTMQGRDLRLYNADTTLARDLSTSVVLERGLDLTEAPRQGSLADLATAAYVLGDEGASLERTNPEAIAPWGRWEAFITNGGVSDTGTMTVLADNTLARVGRERLEDTYGLTFAATRRLPFRDYRPGDFVGLRVAPGQPPERVRCRQVTITVDETSTVTGAVVLNDRFLEDEVRRARRVNGITGGSSAAGGTGGRPAPAGPDTRTPATPQGLTAASVAYQDAGGRTYGLLDLQWSPVLVDVNGVALDVSGYQVLVKRQGDASGAVYATDTASMVLDALVPGTVYTAQVRALTVAGRSSAWSSSVSQTIASDATAPGVPSTPTLTARLGVIRVNWNGLNSQGGGMPADFARVEVALGATATPTAIVGYLEGAGVLPIPGETYGEQRWVRLRSVDLSGNRSGWSTAASVTVAALVDADLVGTTVDERFTTLGEDLADVEVIAQQGAGRSTVFHSLNAPTASTPGNTAGDVWFRRTAADVVIGQWRWDGSAWQSQTLDNAVLATLDAAKITTGTLAAARIAAGSLSAEKLRVGGGTESLVDPMFQSADVRAQRLSASTTSVTFGNDPAIASTTGAWYAILDGTTGVQPNLHLASVPEDSAPIPVVPGRKYRFTARMKRSADYAATSGVRPTIRMRTTTGSTYIAMPGAPTFTPTTDWVDYSWEWTARADAVGVSPALQWNAPTAGRVFVDSVGFAPKMDATLIQDGAVTTEALVANAVTAAKIAANAITADKIDAGAVTTDKLDALAVTAGKIAADAVTADKIAAVLVLASRLIAGTQTGARAEFGDLADGSKGFRLYDTDGTTVLVDMGPGRTATFRGRVEASEFTSQVPGQPRLLMGPTVYRDGGPGMSWDLTGDGLSWDEPHMRAETNGRLWVQGQKGPLAGTSIALDPPNETNGHGRIRLNADGLTGSDSARLAVDAGERAVTMSRVKVGSAPSHGATAIVKRRTANASVGAGTWTPITWNSQVVSLEDDADLQPTTSGSAFACPAGWWIMSATVSIIAAQSPWFVRIGAATGGQVLGVATVQGPTLTGTLTLPVYLPALTNLEVAVYLPAAGTVGADSTSNPTRVILTPLL